MLWWSATTIHTWLTLYSHATILLKNHDDIPHFYLMPLSTIYAEKQGSVTQSARVLKLV
jgi:hypothetical protein